MIVCLSIRIIRAGGKYMHTDQTVWLRRGNLDQIGFLALRSKYGLIRAISR